MKNNRAIEYLSQVQENFQDMQLQAEKIYALRSKAEGITNHAFDEHTSGRPQYRDCKAEIVASVIDLENDITERMQDNFTKYKTIQKQIASLPDFKYRTLLEYRFLCGKTYQEMADILQYDIRSIYKMMNEALASFEEMYLTSKAS